ncbi:uncharacterized protein LOC120321498 [Drosophila yakuba]|uniref:uncharacterized protein LOC120321498 n=1 Tax=Drosophila yakuba TaxID=7245 RepID=UPI0019307FB2|nr:uncharacterized protein LOC120321498 [Drosophila yakuba]XP_039230026.1 uncharacterized protein LOC120321498 [Drosophila yakuba]XP_039230027.1 uncharacterized protein LOC120321498 [Drosophila yakuba]
MKLLNLLLVVLVLIGMAACQRRRKRGAEFWVRPKHNPPGTRHCQPSDPWCRRDYDN